MDSDLSHILALPEETVCTVLRYKKLDSRTIAVSEAYLKLVCLCLKDSRPRVRRYAAMAAGRESELASDALAYALESALHTAWEETPLENERRYIAEALGKLGGERSENLLRSVTTQDPLFTKSISKALLLFERRKSKNFPTQWHMESVSQEALPVRVWCRHGLESLVAYGFDLAKNAFEVKASGLGWVDILLKDSPKALFQNRLFLDFGFKLQVQKNASLRDEKVIAECLFEESTQHILSTFATGPFRIRLQHARSGHQRSLQWDTAEEISKLAQETGFPILNDSRQADWEAVISDEDSSIYLTPKGFTDPRFFYRLTDVPAASHPTIAAALAHVAGVREDDVIWDPFVGSGTELVERHFLGGYRSLIGTDLEPGALANSRTNMGSAAIECNGPLSKVVLVLGDALRYQPKPLATLIICNPPMGRRVQVKDAEAILVNFVRRLPETLSRTGRLVWMSPFPEVLDRELRAIGRSKTFSRKVDMGGFSAELQKWE